MKSLLATLLLLCSTLQAHELHDNQVTVVLHEQHSIAVALLLDFAGLLQHVMAPDANPAEFLALVAAQGPEQLEAGITLLKSQVQQGLVIRNSGELLALSQWQWPTTVVIHAALREQVMAALLDGSPAVENPALQVRAVASDLLPIKRLTLELPELIKPAVVLWYQPQQTVMNPQSPLQVMEF
jgi:hypothetical protein